MESGAHFNVHKPVSMRSLGTAGCIARSKLLLQHSRSRERKRVTFSIFFMSLQHTAPDLDPENMTCQLDVGGT